MNAYFGSKPICGNHGLAGANGNPIGTVISYIGLTAPQSYLVCDGAELNISDWPQLAEFFESQFGAKNHFGGDGETTFCVPDLRNLFLRGYHGEAEEQLSGDVGQKQDATQHFDAHPHDRNLLWDQNPTNTEWNGPKNSDTVSPYYSDAYFVTGTKTTHSGRTNYTSRPVNAAVLYCIKAVN